MAQVLRIRIDNYRSIGDALTIDFPLNKPLVLLGQNNAGKSNIIKAIDLILGQTWPGSHDPEDHEFFKRERANAINILVRFRPEALFGARYEVIRWGCNPTAEEPISFRGRPGQFGRQDGFIRNEDRDTCVCVVLEAERNLRYHLGYSSKWTYLSRLMHRFHRALNEDEQTKGTLEQLFASIKVQFGNVPEFSQFLNELQTQLQDLVGSMTHKLEVNFEAYNPVNFFHALRLQASEGNEPRTLDEMGTGEQQVLAMAFAYAYAKAFHGGILLIVEEPEAHLHPLAQQWLAARMTAMAADGLQIVITTHSPAFIDVVNLDGLVVVRKVQGSTSVKQVSVPELVTHLVASGVPPNLVTPANVLPFYAANATRGILEGFFAQLVVLVEGPTESLSLPVYFEKRGLQVAKEGIAVIPVHGKGNVGKWRRLFVAYEIPCYIIFDNDASDDPTGGKRRDALNAVGIADNHETYVRTDEWWIGDDLAIFGQSFEVALRAAFPAYRRLEAAARAEGIDTKPFVARRVAEGMDPAERCGGWEKVDELIEVLRAKLPSEGDPQEEARRE